MSNPSYVDSSSNTSEYSADYSEPGSPTIENEPIPLQTNQLTELVVEGLKAAMPSIIAQVKETIAREASLVNVMAGNGASTSRNKSKKKKQKYQPTIQHGHPTNAYSQYLGTRPKCNKCRFHHEGDCPVCTKCQKRGHISRYCRMGLSNTTRSCFECGALDHLRPQCPSLNRNRQNVNFQQLPIQQNPLGIYNNRLNNNNKNMK